MSEKYPLALPEGSVLAGQYIIEKVLGQGGFGITYEAKDHKTGGRVAVKEFFPDAMATRTQTSVVPFSGERGESFAYGKECFLQEAETLAKFIGNENIVRIYSYFEENGTAYFVMDFIEGTSFDTYIQQQGGKLSFEETVKILIPVMDALSAVHSKGIIHRDVTPDNIYITADGTVKLLDFGAARYSLGDKSRSLDVVLKHGFAPKEQYTRRGKQGPFTDIYALGATFYFALTGKRPPDSVERMDEDELVPPSTLGVKLPREAEQAILMALNVQPSDRFQNMEAFKSAMLQIVNTADEEPILEKTQSVKTMPSPVEQRYFYVPEPEPIQNSTKEQIAQGKFDWPNTQITVEKGKEQNNKKKVVIPIAVAAIVLLIAGIAIGVNSNRSRGNASTDTVAATTKTSGNDSASQSDISSLTDLDNLPEANIPIEPESTEEEPEEPAAEESADKAPENRSAAIIGNSANSLQNSTFCTDDRQTFSFTEEGDNNTYYDYCLSSIGDEIFALDGKNDRAVKINPDSTSFESELIPELSAFQPIIRLYVSQDYYFIYVPDDSSYAGTLYCVSRDDGRILGEKAFDSPYSFTLANEGNNCFLVFLDGEEGSQHLYIQYADELEAEAVDVGLIPYEDAYGENEYKDIVNGEQGVVYIRGASSDNNHMCFLRYDFGDDNALKDSKIISWSLNGNELIDYNYYNSTLYYIAKIKDTNRYRVFSYEWGGQQETIYEIPDNIEGKPSQLVACNQGKSLFFIARPYLFSIETDGSGEPIILDYYVE